MHYSTVGDDALIYRRVGTGANAETNMTNNVFNPSNTTDSTNFYHPDEDFSSLIGCSINGEWKIEVIDGRANNNHNGYLFDWEIVFRDDLPTGGGSIDSAAVLVPNSWTDDNRFQPVTDTSFVFHAPIVSQNTTISDTLRVYDPSTGCWYDTTLTITVLKAEGTRYPNQTVCAGNSITLEAVCPQASNASLSQDFNTIDMGGDTWHSYGNYSVNGQTYRGPGNKEVDSFPAYVSAMLDFPERTKVFPAGGKVKLGNGDVTGSMTSAPHDLSDPFSLLIRAKGWGTEPTSSTTPKRTRVNVVVDKGQPVEQIKYFDTDPAYRWPGTDAYRDYSLLFDGASVASTITIETVNNGSGYDTRAFVDYVGTKAGGCTSYKFKGPNGTTLYSGDQNTYTVTNSATTNDAGTYTVEITMADGCVRVDTFNVTVNPKPNVNITTNLTNICPNVGNVEITASTPSTAPEYTYSWSSNSSITLSTSTTNTVTATIPSAPGSCGQDYSISVTVVDGNGCEGSANGTIKVRDTEAPVITESLAALSVNGCAASDAPAAYTTVAQLEADGVTVSDNCTPDGQLIVE
ncbi:MAG: hypothetical protein IJK85_07500, partial [Bacteroidales bacterium]|nr:hypothetical protein [Bacteroidales bacterium]